MCLFLIAVEVAAATPLVIGANRDEFRERPASPATFWADAPEVLAGRDLKAGGTWLGVSRTGRVAAVTNVREGGAPRRGNRSRGLLVSDFLKGESAPADTLEELARDGAHYDGFNFVAGDVSGIFWLSNRDAARGVVRLSPGVHGVSNALLDTPWPKLTAARDRMTELLRRDRGSRGGLPADLFALLSDDARHQDSRLPDTGVGIEWERVLSAAFIDTPSYGTRASTTIVFGAGGRVDFEERTHEPGRPAAAARRFTFQIGGTT